ncbi:MAG: hypothetical protein HGN29_12730 [Asgard group archaeon]|nr:hypothetical protein [Asgard group archaeon]
MTNALFLNRKIFDYFLISVLVVSTTIGLIFLSESLIKPKAEIADIFIDCDQDFRAYDFKGKGTKESPYLIENIHFNSEKQFIIHIRFTTKFFTIRNCILENRENVGIFIYKIAPGSALIENNTFTSEIGINLIKTNDIIIEENIFTDFSYGIKIYLSSNNSIMKNDFSNSLEEDSYFDIIGSCTKIESSQLCNFQYNSCFNSTIGLELYNTEALDIGNNNFTSNKIGITAESALSSNFIDNLFKINKEGFLLINSPYSSLTNNNFISNGLTIDERYFPLYDTYSLKNNFVNDQEIGLFVYEENLTINEPTYGQLIIVLCKNVIIQNQNLDNASNGLYIVETKNIQIINNTCNFNLKCGIYFERSHDNIIINNTISNNLQGLSFTRSNHISIENNMINSNYLGLFFEYANDCNIIGNTINYNIIKAITTSRKCDSFKITYNHFEENIGYAIFISDQLYYIIHHNSFIDNALDKNAQCFDSPYPDLRNFWYDILLEEGNYWSDWDGLDDYILDGGGFVRDRYPLSVPPV